MPNRLTLDQAEYKSRLLESLFTTIMEKASGECSADLLNLISIGCDYHAQISEFLTSETEEDSAT
ncbi:hypothetical protein [Pantoea stewartii]|uniref:hypothetical protein n=1 Tax=Pantoea stewartii TaxID=66269 RepID=UPI0016251051|nr:hypothetical protein [Pantoea stewartii]MBC0852584.1 hypothetical protein [Pantoea stewartii]